MTRVAASLSEQIPVVSVDLALTKYSRIFVWMGGVARQRLRSGFHKLWLNAHTSLYLENEAKFRGELDKRLASAKGTLQKLYEKESLISELRKIAEDKDAVLNANIKSRTETASRSAVLVLASCLHKWSLRRMACGFHVWSRFVSTSRYIALKKLLDEREINAMKKRVARLADSDYVDALRVSLLDRDQ